MKIRLGILMGGSSAEREVSYRSAKNIIGNLDENKYEILKYDIPQNGSTEWVSQIIEDKPQVVLSALHGGKGEDGSVQGLLKCLGIPFAGSDVCGSALCMDKALAKLVMDKNHLPIIDGFLVKFGEDTVFTDRDERLGYPLIVKPNRGGSSLGIKVVNNRQDFKAAVDDIFNSFGDDALVEKYIEGREVTCGVLESKNGPEVISVLDIHKKRGIFDYNAKYVDKMWSGGISNLPDYMQDMVRGIAKKAFIALECRGYACVDMIVSEEQIYVVEVNTLPGMTEQSLIPNAVKALNMNFGSFLDDLIEGALNDK